MTILIKNGRVVDPSQGLDKVADLLIESGKISKIGKVSSNSGQVIDAKDLIVTPGLVDLHTHTRFPGGEHKETLESVTQAALGGGYTTIVAMANSPEPVDSQSVLKHVQSQRTKINMLQVAAVTVGLKGKKLVDMEKLAKAGAIGFSDDGNPITNSQLMKLALQHSKALKKPIISHCEDRELIDGAVMNHGRLCVELGLVGMPVEAESRMVARDISLAKKTGGHLHVAHVSTAESCRMINAAKKHGLSVTGEATPHHLALTEILLTSYDARYKMNPPLRTETDRKALVRALKEGKTIDAIATDHAPHSKAEKESEINQAPFGVPGLETSFAVIMTKLGKELPLKLIIDLLSTRPSSIFNLNKGTLRPGSIADVAIFDPNLKWDVKAVSMRTKGAGSPFESMTLAGKAIYTIVQGEIAYAYH